MSRARLRRFVLPGAAAFVFAAFAALWLCGARTMYHAVLDGFGFDSFRFPFLDIHGVLAAVDCARLGIDVYAVNPCDALGRPHDYGPVWLMLKLTPVTADATGVAGILLLGLYCCGLAALPLPRVRFGLAIMLAGALSPCAVFGVERGNIDLLIFAIAAGAARLALRAPWLRLLGLLLAMLGASLKFYPATLLVLAARERVPRCLWFAVAAIAALGALLLPHATEVVRSLGLVPDGSPFRVAFGMRDLAAGLGILYGLPPRAGVLPTMALSALSVALAWPQATRTIPRLHLMTAAERVFLLVGTALFLGCYFGCNNGDYRAIFLLFALPGLIGLAAGGEKVWRVAVILCLLMLWRIALPSGPDFLSLHGQIVAWLLTQAGWWALATFALAALFALLRDSAACRSCLRALAGRPRALTPPSADPRTAS